MRWLLLSWLFVAFAQETDADLVFGAIKAPPAGAPLTDPAAVDAKTQQVASLLRCPVCQGMSVADSREGLSLSMKARIREMVEGGYAQQQIIDYFVERYGEGIVLLPDQRHWAVWFVPVLVLLAGLGYVGYTITRREGAPQPAPSPTPSSSVEANEDSDFDAYRRRVLADLEDS